MKERDEAANKMTAQFDPMVGQGEVKKDKFPVDVLCEVANEVDGDGSWLGLGSEGGREVREWRRGRRTLRRGRDKMVGFDK